MPVVDQSRMIDAGPEASQAVADHGLSTGKKGFTLVELLVVIGIIALLISMLLPALNKARNTAVRTQCASNIRQLGTFWHLYANDHKGFFPNTGMNYNLEMFLWEQRQTFVDKYGVSDGKFFFCPRSFYPHADYWNYQITYYPPKDIMIAGYMFWPAQANNTSAMTVSWDLAAGTNLPPLVKNSDRRAAEIPLAFDFTMYSSSEGYKLASHMEGGQKPAGGNVLYGDGHAVWKRFENMTRAGSPYPTYDPYF